MAQSKKKIVDCKLKMKGIRPIMFDRYPGDNNTVLPPEDKMYLVESEGQKIISLPISNLYSFLGAENTMSAAKKLHDPRKYRPIAQAAISFTLFEPAETIPFIRDGNPIAFNGFDENERDDEAKVYIRRDVARMKDGIPNPKIRPVLDLPWELNVGIKHFDNPDCSFDQLKNLFERGGIALGLGTYRGVFGKFECEWEIV